MTRKAGHISILQFDERVITRLRVRRSGKGLEVLSYDREQGAWAADDGSLEAALKEFGARHNLPEDNIYTVLPRHEMTARLLELPSQDRAELENMLRLSAEEYVPFPTDELVIDHGVLQLLPDGQARVLAVFAHRDVVETHLKLLRGAGLEPDQVYLSTACLASGAIAAHPPGSGRYALVNLASGGLEVVVVRDGRLDYGRAVASAQDWCADGEPGQEAMEELRVELRASLSAYRRESEDGAGAGTVFLCSDWLDVGDLSEALVHELGEECQAATFGRDLITQGGARVPVLPIALLGAALIAQDRGALSIRLLPETVLEERRAKGAKRKAVRFALLAGAILVALLGLYVQAVRQREGYIRGLRRQITELEPRATGIMSKQKQLNILQNQVKRSGTVLELMASLTDLFPSAGVNITRFIFTHDQHIELFGRAKSREDVERLAQSIIDVGKSTLPQFARAQQAYEQETSERGQRVWDFKIIVPFPEAEAPTEEGAEVE